MKNIPSIDSFFDLEKSLMTDGFKIDEKDNGNCVAHGFYYGSYGEIFIEFHQSFINNYQSDMAVFHYNEEHHQEMLFIGVAPTNQHDYDVLMQLLFPTDSFKDRLDVKYMQIG